MPRTTKAQREAATRCSVPGCEKPWASAWNGLRRCQKHMERPTTKQVPETPPSRAWNETDKD